MPKNMHLAFGRDGISADLPDGYDYVVLDVKSASALSDEPAAIQAALDAPIGCAPLVELARGKRTAAISVCDITRPAPNRKVLPHVLKRLEDAGIPREGIVILIATGLHRPATDEEILEIAGPDIAGKYRVENHEARDFASHTHLGTTKSGTPVYVDSRFATADIRITLGFIEPHLMAGFSGGRKLVAPGLAAQETIKVLHSPRFMREPRAVEGSILDNPLHRELIEIAALAGHSFMVDVALARDRGIARVFAGDPIAAHRAGVEFVSKTLLQALPKQVDAVITTAAGYPLDLTYYQCVKGVTAASHIVRDGGRILIAGACAEGSGGPEFTRLLSAYPNPESFLDAIADAPVTVDQWQLEKLALVARRMGLYYCVPGLAPEIRAKLWGPAYAGLPESIDALLGDLAKGSTVAVIPEGPYVLARITSSTA